jgi:multiple sugar transport system permease protein
MAAAAPPLGASGPKPPSTETGSRIGARSEAIAGYLFIAVPMGLFLVLQIGMLIYAGWVSIWDWDIRLGPQELIGLQNFQKLLTDPGFLNALKNTTYYAVVWVPLTMAAGLFLAVVVNQKIRGQAFFRSSFYFPAIASSAAITTLWLFLVAPGGLFNEIRGALGLNPVFTLLNFAPNQDWAGNFRTAMNTIILLNVWTTSGTFMLFYLASLQAIPTDVYEAAAIDGAGQWQTFWRVTFPLLRPAHFFVATVAFIGAFQLFDQAFIVGGVDGAPAGTTMTVVLYLYNAVFRQINLDFAAAVGIVLFVIILGVTLIQRRLFPEPDW